MELHIVHPIEVIQQLQFQQTGILPFGVPFGVLPHHIRFHTFLFHLPPEVFSEDTNICMFSESDLWKTMTLFYSFVASGSEDALSRACTCSKDSRVHLYSDLCKTAYILKEKIS